MRVIGIRGGERCAVKVQRRNVNSRALTLIEDTVRLFGVLPRLVPLKAAQ